MTASERSFIGLAKQTGKGTPNTTDADFKYLLFRAGGLSPNNLNLPLDPEVGGGAMLRNVVKVGVTSGGALDLIPRPDTLGLLLLGALGEVFTENYHIASVLPKTTLLAGAQPGYVTGKVNPPSPIVLKVKGWPANVALTGNVDVHGTNAADAVINEVVALSGASTLTTTAVFKTVTSFDLPARINAGDQVSIGFEDGVKKHVFTLPTDQFDAPYWTARSAPGNLWGEQFQDLRINGLVLNFAGARFLEGACTLMGGLPTPVATTNWDAASKVDNGPQFLSPLGSIEVPTGAPIKTLSGSLAFGIGIPLEEQWIIGSYSPDDFQISSRGLALNLNVKIEDGDLYKKMMYDPAAGSAWVADLFKEADIKLFFQSPIGAGIISATKYSLDVDGLAAGDNIVWSAAPIGIRAGRQVIMSITGTWLAQSVGEPITCTLVNRAASY